MPQFDALVLVEGPQAQLAPGDQCLAQLLDAACLATGKIGCFEAQGVVLVLGDILFMGSRFVGAQRRLVGLLQVSLQMREHLLQQ